MTSAAVVESSKPGLAKSIAPVQRPKSRAVIVVVMVISLLFAGVLRWIADNRQAAVSSGRGVAQSRSTLGTMDSFALALLLGGLRGPLVMFLWSTSESQKSDRDLEDFDTKIEWIRLLQPEFDTVHIFQIWNKAYNISAMMSSPANKYAVIMEALDYAQKVDAERPGDVNILSAMANVYGGKLGASNLTEFPFYWRQFRSESLVPAHKAIVYSEKEYGPLPRLDRWKPLLDDHDLVRADLLVPTRPRAEGIPPDAEWNDGSELQYLKQFGAFPYGISPAAMNYNYSKRAEVSESTEGQKPLQLSVMVLDSRPAIALKQWMEDDARIAHDYEAKAFGIKDSLDLAVDATRASATESIKNRAALTAALYFFDSAARVSHLGLSEYARHLAKPDYMMRVSTYRSHIADLTAGEAMYNADRDYILAELNPDRQSRIALFHQATENYAKAMLTYQRAVLDYYIEGFVFAVKGPQLEGGSVLPPGYTTKSDLDKLPDDQVASVYNKAYGIATHAPITSQEYREERTEYGRYVTRCLTRMNQIFEERKK